MSTVRRVARGRSFAEKALRLGVALAVGSSWLAGIAKPASAIGPNAVVTDPGCSTNQPPPAPDGSIALPFPINFGGTTYTSFYLSGNGYLAFAIVPDIEFSREDLPAPVIAPFYAGTDPGSAGTITHGTTTFGTRTALCVNWLNVEPSGQGYQQSRST